VISSLFLQQNAREWHNPAMVWITLAYRRALYLAIRLRWLTLAGAAGAVALSWYLASSGVIGSEFLPHLDEGAIWARATLAPSTGATEGTRVMNQARGILASVPGSDSGGQPIVTSRTMERTPPAFSTRSFFVDLKPKERWRPVFQRNKEELVAAMDRELEKIPGALWNFSQPIADNMEEAVSGVKGQLAIKILRRRLEGLEAKGEGSSASCTPSGASRTSACSA